VITIFLIIKVMVAIFVSWLSVLIAQLSEAQIPADLWTWEYNLLGFRSAIDGRKPLMAARTELQHNLSQ